MTCIETYDYNLGVKRNRVVRDLRDLIMHFLDFKNLIGITI